MVAELSGPTTFVRRYVYGPGDDEPLLWYEGSGTTDRRWLHADERGSVIAVSDAGGNAIAINAYDEYGIPATTSVANAGRFRYTGQMYFPEYGLYSYKARFYSPTLGRFMQADPIEYEDGVNLYDYVGGDPVNHRDPSGLCRDNAESVDQCGNFSRQNGRESGEGAWLWNYISSQNQGDGYGNGGIGAFQDVASVHAGIKADYIASRNAYAAGYNIHGRYVGYNPLEGKRVDEIHVFAERAVPQNSLLHSVLFNKRASPNACQVAMQACVVNAGGVHDAGDIKGSGQYIMACRASQASCHSKYNLWEKGLEPPHERDIGMQRFPFTGTVYFEREIYPYFVPDLLQGPPKMWFRWPW